MAFRAFSFLLPRRHRPDENRPLFVQAPSEPPHFRRARADMIRHQLRSRGITDIAMLRAMARLPRHLFLPAGQQAKAYLDQAVGVEAEQSISQPFMVAIMTQHLKIQAGNRILEIGTGTGYQTALLAMLSHHVYTVERNAGLYDLARERLAGLGLANIFFQLGDGSAGWPQHAPYDRIIVTAAAPDIPPPLLDQLDINGRMIIPVGDRTEQQLIVVERSAGITTKKSLIQCRFVPLLGRFAWVI